MPKRLLVVVASLLTSLLLPVTARAHCDTLDGPVAQTARAALDAGEVAPVLAWVKPDREPEIRAAFRTALDARRRAPASRDTSDLRFLETLVRVHRAGEGAPYAGLKPAGSAVPEAVRAADAAIASRDGAPVEEQLVDAVREGLRRRFETLGARRPPGADVAAGRAWVEAYVEYVHYVERLDAAAHAGADRHGEAAHDATPATGRPAAVSGEGRHAHAH